MSLKLGMVRGAFSLGGTRLALSVFAALALVILARLLTPVDFGIVAIASSILSIVQSFTELSLSNALIHREKVERSHIDTVWTMAVIRAGLIVAIFSGLAWPLAQLYAMPQLVPVFFVSGLTGAIVGLQNPHITLMTKQLRFGPMAAAQFVQRFLGLVVAIALAFAFRSYWAIIAGNLLGALLALVFTYVVAPYRPRFSLEHVGEIWSFSGWIFFKQLCETINWRVDQLIIGAIVPKAQLGIYAMADSLAVIPSRETVHPLRQTLFPGLANLNGDPARLRQASLRAQATLAMVVAPLGVGLAVVAEPAVRIVLGEKWMAAVPYVQIAALLYTFGTFSIALQPIAMALGKTRILFLQQAAVLLLKIPLLFVGLSYGGLIGAALARCFAEFVSMIVEMWATKMLTGVTIARQAWTHMLTVVALATMSLGVYFLHTSLKGTWSDATMQLALAVPAGAAIYVSTIAVLWLAAGRPDGPVSELLSVSARIIHAIRSRTTRKGEPAAAMGESHG